MHSASTFHLLTLLATTLFSLPTLTNAACGINTYNGYSCDGQVIGTDKGSDVSGLICCLGSSSCGVSVGTSTTTCSDGRSVPLAQASTLTASRSTATQTGSTDQFGNQIGGTIISGANGGVGTPGAVVPGSAGQPGEAGSAADGSNANGGTVIGSVASGGPVSASSGVAAVTTSTTTSTTSTPASVSTSPSKALAAPLATMRGWAGAAAGAVGMAMVVL